ncbi:MAG: hypothetical protein SCK70_09305, partial [bacterium]|nr:hypothetical protein [bacterium]
LFFTGYLPKIQEDRYHWIYTIFAGGDDLFFIGEWQEAIKFAKELYQQFRDYTGWNRDITLSSAVYVMQPRHPIRTAAEIAEEMLERAKGNDRDSMAIFDIVVKQDKIDELMEMADFLDSKRRKPDTESKINSAFLHRLVRYRQMAMNYLEENNIEGLMYMSRLAYDIGRNIVKWDEQGKIKKGKDENMMLKDLTDVTKIRKMEKMELPIFWSIFKNRKIQ